MTERILLSVIVSLVLGIIARIFGLLGKSIADGWMLAFGSLLALQGLTHFLLWLIALCQYKRFKRAEPLLRWEKK